MSATMVGGQWKIKKNTGLNILKQSKTLAKVSWSSPPNSEIWTKIKMIQNLTFRILFLKTFRAYNFFIFVHLFQWTLSELFLISDFLTENLKANKN